MRINHLELQAVGPFPSKHVIDFDQLGESALFLIDGPTGAGKSTLIDAITYAIYGQMAGSESDSTRMRSTHAKPETETYVDLVFSTQSGKYRVRRAPAYDRPKSRGTGVTAEKASVLVEQLMPDGSKKNFAFQFKEAATFLADRIGLSREQFVQTVVLPQGEFAKFLRADTKERQPLLERIFATEIYARVADVLKDQASSAKKESEAATTELKEAIVALVASAALDEEVADTLAELSEQSSTHESLVAQLQLAMAEVKTSNAAAKSVFDVEQAERHRLTEKLEARRGESAIMAGLELATADHLAAAQVFTEAAAHADLDAIAVELGKEMPKSKAGKHDFELVLDRLRELQRLVDEALALEKALPNKANDLDEMTSKLLALSKELGDADVAVKKTLPVAIQAAKAKVEEKAKNLPDPEAVSAKILQLEEEMGLIASLEAAQSKQEKLDAAAEKAKGKAHDAVQAAQQSSASRYANMAAELALELEDGKQCRVCGSLEHPSPAPMADDAVTQEDMQNADKLAEAASKAFAAADKAAAEGKAAIAQIAKQVKRKLEAVTSELSVEVGKREGFEAAATQLSASKGELKSLEDELAETNSRRTEVTAEIAALKISQKALSEELAEGRANIKAMVHFHPNLIARKQVLAEQASLLRELNAAETALNAKAAALEAAKLLASTLPKEPCVGDVETAREELAAHQRTYDEALAQKTIAQQALKSFNTHFNEIITRADNRIAVEGDSAHLVALSKWAEGANKLGQKLPAFVLQTMFEEVVTAANARFTSILEGRYELRIPDDDPARKGSKGLGLAVFDRPAQSLRKTTTLSGGEQFCASLSLALGLSDVVLSNASGLSIDTFFIDEGFGSLDSGRLSQVMQMLDGLKADGRAVGLISHVEELKTAITERIDVRQDESTNMSTLSVNWMK